MCVDTLLESTWRGHGGNLGRTWRAHGNNLGKAWRAHGNNLGRDWRAHGYLSPGPVLWATWTMHGEDFETFVKQFRENRSWGAHGFLMEHGPCMERIPEYTSPTSLHQSPPHHTLSIIPYPSRPPKLSSDESGGSVVWRNWRWR